MFKKRTLSLAVFASITIISSANALDGNKRYGKCWVAKEVNGKEVMAGYDCNAAGVSCPNPGYNQPCTVNGIIGSHEPGIRKERAADPTFAQ